METTTSHRPWETRAPPPSLPPPPQTLPSIASLTSKLPATALDRAPTDLSIPPPQRDSGSWMTPGARESVPSRPPPSSPSLLGSCPPDETDADPVDNVAGSSAHSGNSMPYLNSAHSPTGVGHSPFTPEHQPSSAFGGIAHQPNGLPPPTSDSHPHRGSGDFDDSRRSSMSNSIHQGMNNLMLGGPTSPYTSGNASQTSLVSGLQRERGIQTNGFTGGRYSTMSGPISTMNSSRGGRSNFAAGRVAPPILENPKSEVYSAEAPTRGQAYAFPDPDAPVRPPGKPPSTFSRRNSFAESFGSSVLTVESSRLPLGQHPTDPLWHHPSMVADATRADLPDGQQALQHKQIDSLRGDPESPNGMTPYSRTPELRVTHKLAERKRRSEMKDCFEQLRSRLPQNQNNKSSKWETLSRAIEYINQLENQTKQQRVDYDSQRHKIAELEAKMHEMSQQMRSIQQQPPSAFPPPPNAMPQSPLGYGSHYGNHIDASSDPPRTLPPLLNNSMQGVQYSDDRR